MLWDSWWNVWRGRSLPKRRRVASGSSLERAADVAGAWSNRRAERLEDRLLLTAEGGLDPAFGNAGKVTSDFNAESANDIVIQEDGRIVVVGGTVEEQDGESKAVMLVVRYNIDGSLDSSFGAGGKASVTFGGSTDAAAVALQADGKIVVAGNVDGIDFALSRFNSDGSLDLTFGVDGKITTDFGQSEWGQGVSVDRDGKIVVVGFSGEVSRNNRFAIARYNPDGSLDTSFDLDGKVTTAIGSNSSAGAVAIQSDGKIVVAGNSIDGTQRFAVVRYNPNGSLDPSFDTDGILTTSIAGIHSIATDLAVSDDGKLVVVGRSSDFSDAYFAVARYHSNGSLDISFDGDGRLTTTIPGHEYAWSTGVGIQPDGRILASGYAYPTTAGTGSLNFVAVRYNNNGSLDNTFDNDGRVVVDFGGASDAAYCMAMQENGQPVIAGSSDEYGTQRIAVIRLIGFNNEFSLSTLDTEKVESNQGMTPFTFTVTREAGFGREMVLDFVVTGSGNHPADANDFGGEFPTGTVTFAASDASKTMTIDVSGDLDGEYSENYALTLTDRRTGNIYAMIDSTIRDDDGGELTFVADLGETVNASVLPNGQVQVTIGAMNHEVTNPAALLSLMIVGNDTADSMNLTGLSRSVYPNLASVVLSGGAGNDTIIGSGFNDVISGGAGDDSLSGGGGTDRLVEEITAPSDPAVVSMVKLAATTIKTKYTMTGLGADTIADIEEMSLAGSAGKDKIDVKKFRGSVTLSGNGGNDTLIGGAGNDSLDGGEGNDKLTGNGGTNQLVGGNGTDYVIEAGATNFVLTPSTLTGLGHETLNSIERASLTTANTSSRIDATAFRGVTILTGGSGNDTLLGGAGKDSISGGDGHDTLIGGNANDTLDGEAGDDALAGQSGHDSLIGGDGQDTIIGGAGYDTLLGGLGDDLLIGGLGKDSLDGEAGNDTGLGGQGGAARGGNGLKNSGDSLTGIELIDESLGTLFAWE
ncbi:MAG: hypothetical protein ACKV2Q_29305 [Planctomycetaceae bacterium]